MINLRKLELKDSLGMLEWMKDSELMENFRFDSKNKKLRDVEEFITSTWNDKRNIHYAIVDDQEEYLGTISLKNINEIDKNGEYAIALRRKAIGTGVAKEATRLLLKESFESIGLEKIYLNVLSENRRAIRFYEKFGFIKEGEFLNHSLIKGKFQNLSWYAIFRGETKNEKL